MTSCNFQRIAVDASGGELGVGPLIEPSGWKGIGSPINPEGAPGVGPLIEPNG